MPLSLFMAFFLPCSGMIVMLLVYACLLCFLSNNGTRHRSPVKPAGPEKGLSPKELEKLPKTTGKELAVGTECTVCLEGIEGEQPARVVPGCNHGFHLNCADTWLSNHSLCPVCRANLKPEVFKSSSENPC